MPRAPRHHYALVFRCADASLYATHAPDPAAAETALNSGEGTPWLRPRLPVMLAYAEEHMNAQSAVRGVKALKGLSRAEKEALLRSWIPPEH